MGETIFRGGTIVTVDDSFQVLSGDVACSDGEIVQVGVSYAPLTSDYEILDCAGCVVMPGLVQSHVHMCQTLARGWEWRSTSSTNDRVPRVGAVVCTSMRQRCFVLM